MLRRSRPGALALALSVLSFFVGLVMFFRGLPAPRDPPAAIDMCCSVRAARAAAPEPILLHQNRLPDPPTPGARRPAFSFPISIAPPPVISVVMPFRDTPAELFSAAVESLRGQTLQSWELIVVDDASERPPAAVSDPRVRIVRASERGGPSAARNLGLGEASADYVFFLDSDDLLEPTALEKHAWHLASHPEHAFCSSWIVGFGAQSYVWRRGFGDGPAAFLRENLAVVSALWRREDLLRLGGFEEGERSFAGCEDWALWLRAADAGLWGATIAEPLIWYRRIAREASAKKWSCWENPPDWRSAFPSLARQTSGVRLHARQPYAPLDLALPFAAPDLRPPGSFAVLCVFPWLKIGGADKYNLEMVAGLVSRGARVTIVATRPETEHEGEAAFLSLTSDVHVLSRLVPYDQVPRYLLHLLASRRPDVALVSNSDLGYRLLPLLRDAAPPSTAFVALDHMQEEYRSGGHARSSAAAEPLLDGRIAVSQDLERWLRERGAFPHRSRVCYFGLWPRERVGTRSEFVADASMPIVAIVGRLVGQKRPLVALRALERLGSRPFVALFAGDGPERIEMEAYLRDRPRLRERVLLLGELPFEEAERLIDVADACLLPSRNEGISLTLLECRRAGAFVVGAAVGGQDELGLTDREGVLVPFSEDQEQQAAVYAAALEIALRRGPRRGERAGPDRFSASAMHDCISEALCAAVSRRRASPAPGALQPAWLAREQALQAVETARSEQTADAMWTELERGRTEQSRLAAELAALRKSADEVWREAERLRGLATAREEDDGKKKVFFLRGAGKSGTNWAASLLNSHPRVCVRGEFNFRQLLEAQSALLSDPLGLVRDEPFASRLLEGTESALRSVIAAPYRLEFGTGRRLDELPESADWIGDQSPDPLTAPWPPIRGAKTFYLIRDPRDVVVSWLYHQLRLCTSGRVPCPVQRSLEARGRASWDRKLAAFSNRSSWDAAEMLVAPDDEQLVSQMFGSLIVFHEAYVAAKVLLPAELLLKVRYEDMWQNATREADRMHRFLGLEPVPPDEDAHRLELDREDPWSFLRGGGVGGWCKFPALAPLVPPEIRTVLSELGYEAT